MSKTLTFKQYQMISAYIDGRCSDREKAKVESLCAANAHFASTLAEFKRSQKMLKALPRVKVPRNFTLSPALAPQKPQRFFLAPALNYAALTAALLCVFLFAGTQFLPSIAARKAAAPEAMLMTASDASATFAPEMTATAYPMITWGMQKGIGGGGGGAEGSGLSGIGGGPMVAAAPTLEPKGLAPDTTTQTTGDMSNLILGIPDESIQGKVISSEPAQVVVEPRHIDWVLAGEIGLASLAFGLALVSWLLKRRH
jgi:hypothetical protein